MSEYIDATSYESSSNQVITELHDTIVTLRARIITLEKQSPKMAGYVNKRLESLSWKIRQGTI